MSNPNGLWSAAEDEALRIYYQEHGPSWGGWSEVLPDRTVRALSSRAGKLGLTSVYHRSDKSAKKRQGVANRVPDPYERQVMRCMNDGMTPTEIDAAMKWNRGTARKIISEKWLREKERGR